MYIKCTTFFGTLLVGDIKFCLGNPKKVFFLCLLFMQRKLLFKEHFLHLKLNPVSYFLAPKKSSKETVKKSFKKP